jgi:OmcA/MtrC family decaheme c-type cytochrome
MNIAQRFSKTRWGLAALLAVGLAGCSGGGGDSSTSSGTTTTAVITAAAANPSATNTADNQNQAFMLIEGAGLSPVTVNSPPVVNFTVVGKSGQIITGLTASNARFAIAKLVPGADGNPDQWVSYISTNKARATGIGTSALTSATQATTDSGGTLEYNAAGGYYTYTFKTDITDASKTNGVAYEPSLTHRVGIQLSYTDSDATAVKVNPYYDFTVVNSKSVKISDAAKTRLMADVNNCNSCHNQLALHGGGRVDVQYCVMCHNPGTVDPESGENLDLKQMVHRIHAGRRLKAEGITYKIWGHQNAEHDYSHAGFPQDLRNCSKCHSESTATPQGDNWKNKPSKEACLTCHITTNTAATDDWYDVHVTTLKLGTSAATMDNNCNSCHGAGKTWSAEQMHWNQNEENAANYKMNITSAAYNSNTRQVTIAYNVTNPTVTPTPTKYDLTAAKFANVRFYLAYQNMPGWSASNPTDFSSYNNGGNGASVKAADGTNDGTNSYTAVINVPADTANMIATGTARVLAQGRVVEPKLDVVTRTEVAGETVNVTLPNEFKDVVLSGALTPRRVVVSDEKCDSCHGTLGTTSGSNELVNAFHRGDRDSIVTCALCHDANRASSTLMADGSGYNESYQFKRMIHGIHGGAKRANGFFHGTENLSAEVAYPGILSDCTTCHENNSYQSDRGVLGAVISKKDPDPLTGTATTDPTLWKVISPKAASCTACHDSETVKTHVISTGGAAYGYRFQGFNVVPATQANILAGTVAETCDGCHAPGAFKGVDIVHQIPTQNVD